MFQKKGPPQRDAWQPMHHIKLLSIGCHTNGPKIDVISLQVNLVLTSTYTIILKLNN